MHPRSTCAEHDAGHRLGSAGWIAVLVLAIACADSSGNLGAQEPPLPAGLGQQEPALPAGLGQDEPSLPQGLESNETPPLPVFVEDENGFPDSTLERPWFPEAWGRLRGFFDLRVGRRLRNDADQSRWSLGEARLQTEWDRQFEHFSATVRTDLLADAVAENHVVLPDDGHGIVDVREAKLHTTPASWLDLDLGRQILTWGTGDLLFLNDLFPKDYSYFLGRDSEYLKAPSDAVKASLFHEFANLDLVVSPWFDGDRFPDGTRQSVFNPFLGEPAGRDDVLRTHRPDHGELAARLSRRFESAELALYGYRGYWKSPMGLDPARGRLFHPRMDAWGGSVRGPQFGGISSVEFVLDDSVEDRSGDDPLVANSLASLLLAHEHTLARDLTLGLQYLVERTAHHGALERAAPPGSPIPDEFRHLWTTRLTYLSHRQTVRWSFFFMHSPSDRDGYCRPSVTLDRGDRTKIELGANLLFGHENTTDFGQLEKTTNVYGSLRFSF